MSDIPAPPPPPPAPAAPSLSPDDGPPGLPASPRSGRKTVIVGAAAIAALAVGSFVIADLTGGGSTEAVVFEPIGATGPSPFVAELAHVPAGSMLAFAGEGADSDAVSDGEQVLQVAATEAVEVRPRYEAAAGNSPLLYEGTRGATSCDPDRLVDLLTADSDKAAAWAAVAGIEPGDIDDYVADLTPVRLHADTRVVNHGFEAGTAAPRQSVLQSGWAVMVDARGVPRVNCDCGNPLRPPTIGDTESYTGTKWSSFDPTKVATIDEATEDLAAFALSDADSGETFSRPVGTRGEADGDAVEAPPGEGTAAGAAALDVGTTLEGRIQDGQDEVRHPFDAPDGAVMTFTVANAAASEKSLYATIHSQGTGYGSGWVEVGATKEFDVVLDHQGGAVFEVAITEGPADYQIDVSLDVQDDAGHGGDAGGDFATAVEVDAGQAVGGLLGGDDTTDMYLVDLQPGSELTVDFENERASSKAVYLDVRHAGDRLYSSWVNPGASTSFARLFSGDANGDIEIIVTEGPGEYTFQADFVAQSDAGTGADAANSLAGAETVTVGEEHSGRVGQGDPADWYLFDHPGAEGQVAVSIPATSTETIYFDVQNASGDRVTSGWVKPGTTVDFDFPTDERGAVYRIIVTEGRADYSFTIQGRGDRRG